MRTIDEVVTHHLTGKVFFPILLREKSVNKRGFDLFYALKDAFKYAPECKGRKEFDAYTFSNREHTLYIGGTSCSESNCHERTGSSRFAGHNDHFEKLWNGEAKTETDLHPYEWIDKHSNHNPNVNILRKIGFPHTFAEGAIFQAIKARHNGASMRKMLANKRMEIIKGDRALDIIRTTEDEVDLGEFLLECMDQDNSLTAIFNGSMQRNEPTEEINDEADSDENDEESADIEICNEAVESHVDIARIIKNRSDTKNEAGWELHQKLVKMYQEHSEWNAAESKSIGYIMGGDKDEDEKYYIGGSEARIGGNYFCPVIGTQRVLGHFTQYKNSKSGKRSKQARLYKNLDLKLKSSGQHLKINVLHDLQVPAKLFEAVVYTALKERANSCEARKTLFNEHAEIVCECCHSLR